MFVGAYEASDITNWHIAGSFFDYMAIGLCNINPRVPNNRQRLY